MAKYRGNGKDNTITGSDNDDSIKGKGGRDHLYGMGGDDHIDGGVGDDFLFGGDGNDILFGGRGSDTMQGGAGADQFKGGKGSDTVDYSASTSAVTAYLALGNSGGDAAGDSYASMENVIGSAYDDLLQANIGGKAFGGAGADMLYGGGALFSTENGGRLRGDAGYDGLSMYYGNTEAWLQNGQGPDTIYGFDEGSDMFFIKLSDFGLGDTLSANEIRTSNSGTAFGTHAQLIYEDDVGKLWFDSNGTGAGGKILVATLEGATIDDHDLGLDDFNFIL